MNDLENALIQIKVLFSKLDQEIIKNGEDSSEELIQTTQRSFLEFVNFINEKIGLNSSLDYFGKEQWGSRLHQEFLPYILLTRSVARFYSKPLGYAGDYKSIDLIYSNIGEGHGRIGALIDQFFLETSAAKAVRNRRKILVDEIHKTTQNSDENEVQIVSLACGPSREIFDFYQSAEQDKIERLKVSLVDFDKEAINFVRGIKKNLGLQDKIKLFQENLLHIALGKTSPNFNDKDLVYSLGIMDYFPDKVVIKLLNWIHQILKPGGKVIVGNFHPKNPCKVLMDHILQWKLNHRDEEQIADLFKKSAFDCAPTKIYFEDEGINLFAECVKS